MWTGGKPPRIPHQQQQSGGRKATSAQSDGTGADVFRPTGVNAELEALKQRGLAKILNKHFTETADQLAQEKAAVDAAIADLERRKANTSEFQSTTNGALSPLDAMYVKANAWRNETRRKERETLLLYQRYVDKFGNTGQVRLPDSCYAPTSELGSRGTLVGACGAPSPHNNDAKNPQTGSPAPVVPVRDGKSWIVHDDGSVTSADKPAAPASAPSSSLVPTMAAEIERSLDEYIQKGGLGLPSVEVLGSTERTFHSARTREEQEFRNFYRRQLEKRGIDAKSPARDRARRSTYLGPGWVESLGPGIMPHDLLGDQNDEGDEDIELLDEENEEDDDDCSAVSGLTSLHSHITRSVIQDCERSVVEFLQEERINIQKLLLQQHEFDDDDDDDCYTAQLLQESGTKNLKTTKATEDAENMVKQMENILHEYQTTHNTDTELQTKNDTTHEPRRYYTDNADELWMVYYDEFYKQEYYHECNSNRTQWDPPSNGVNNDNNVPNKDASSTSVSGTGSDVDVGSISSGHANNNTILGYDDVMPENGRRRSLQHRGSIDGSASGSYRHSSSLKSSIAYESRIAEFRRKRRRERKRKMIGLFFLTIISIVTFISYCAMYQPQVLESVTTKLDEYYNTYFIDTSSRSIVMESKLSSGSVNPFVFDFQPTASVCTDESAIAVAKKKARDDKAAMLHAKALERRQKRQEEIERREYLRRPWACNLPFAYLVHGRCKRLAKQNPLFNLQEIIMSLLH